MAECDWIWYVMEYSPLQNLCFGYVIGDENELGYFSLDELESLQYKYGVDGVLTISTNDVTRQVDSIGTCEYAV